MQFCEKTKTKKKLIQQLQLARALCVGLQSVAIGFE